MQKHLPGSTFVVRNMPGAGQIIGANFIYAAEPDGLTIGTFNTGLIYAQLAGKTGVKFDLSRMSLISKVASDPASSSCPSSPESGTSHNLRACRPR